MGGKKTNLVAASSRLSPRSIAVLALLAYFILLFVPERYVLRLGDEWFWFYDVLLFVLLPIALVCVTARALSLTANDLGLATRTSAIASFVARSGAMTLLFWLTMYAGYLIGAAFASQFPEVLPQTFSYLEVLPQSQPWRIGVVIYLAVTAGVGQEIMFRGIPLAVLARFNVRSSLAWYLVVSSLGFAAWHWDKGLATVTAAVAVGMMAGLAYWRQRDLLALIIAHGAVDLYWLGIGAT